MMQMAQDRAFSVKERRKDQFMCLMMMMMMMMAKDIGHDMPRDDESGH